jgi:hypothetical protein
MSLLTLTTFGCNRGDRLPGEATSDKEVISRRKFIQFLAYTCDFQKGGDTVTAIGVEQRDDQVIYWIASNRDVEDQVILHLKWCLGELRKVSAEEVPANDLYDGGIVEMKQKFVNDCISFAGQKVSKVANILKNAINKIPEALPEEESYAGEHTGDMNRI